MKERCCWWITSTTVDDDGALTVGKPAQDIRENIERAISRMSRDDLIVLANDSHDWDAPHPEKKLFPPHALASTRGAETVVAEALEKAAAPVMTVNKTRYSAFFGTGLADMLRGAGVSGCISRVCTDIYVLHTAVEVQRGLRHRDFGDCVASFNPADTNSRWRISNVLGLMLSTVPAVVIFACFHFIIYIVV